MSGGSSKAVASAFQAEGEGSIPSSRSIYIVGGGMFGQVAADFLRAKGLIDITIIDSREQYAATSCSGNLTKPSWITGLGKAAEQAYKDLDHLYGLIPIRAKAPLGRAVDLFAVPKFKNNNAVNARVLEIEDGRIKLQYPGEDPVWANSDIVLVAAGVWSGQLISMPPVEKIVGVSLTFLGKNHPAQFSIWAPYKQAISYQCSENEVWFGDGTAIKSSRFYEPERVAASIRRAESHGLFLNNLSRSCIGYRPYVKGYKNGYFARVYERIWVSTGGGKNGIVLAVVQARKFWEELKQL